MSRYLIDTHILVWLIQDDDKQLNNHIRENIEYFQHPHYVSVDTLREIVILQSLKRIKLDYSLAQIIAFLNESQITVLPMNVNHILALEKLPFFKFNGKSHDDPFDRLLIAQAIAERYTLVSADTKFPRYRDCGLDLLVNSY